MLYGLARGGANRKMRAAIWRRCRPCLGSPAPLYSRRAAMRPRGPRPSSRGLGRRPFTAKTGVRIPLGAPLRNKTGNANSRPDRRQLGVAFLELSGEKNRRRGEPEPRTAIYFYAPDSMLRTERPNVQPPSWKLQESVGCRRLCRLRAIDRRRRHCPRRASGAYAAQVLRNCRSHGLADGSDKSLWIDHRFAFGRRAVRIAQVELRMR